MIPIDTFYRVTKYDLKAFFQTFADFVNTYYDGYIEYYKGSGSLDNNASVLINWLDVESKKIEDIFELNKESLSEDIDMQDLYTDFSDVRCKIETILATPKWTRSSYVSDYDKNITTINILKQNQTLEDLTSDLGYDDPDNDWSSLAVNNALLEKDYDQEGGNKLKSTFSVNNRINTTSVVDVMVDKNVLGKDLQVKIAIEDDDLVALEPEDTLYQAAEIMIGLRRGSVPEFPQDGVSAVVGSNIRSFKYPIVFRQLSEVFRKDDTFKELEVIRMDRDQDNVVMDVRIVSKLNDVMNKGVYING